LWLDPSLLTNEEHDWEALGLAWEKTMIDGTKLEIGDDFACAQSEEEVQAAFKDSIKGYTKAWIKKELTFVDNSELLTLEVPASGFVYFRGMSNTGNKTQPLTHQSEWLVQVPFYAGISVNEHDVILKTDVEEEQDLLGSYKRARTDLSQYDQETKTHHLQKFRDSVAAHTSGKMEDWKTHHPYWKEHARQRIKATARATAYIGGGTLVAGVLLSSVMCSVM
jgi:hypothetical protein